MKKIFNEEHKLPLTFQYLEIIKKKKTNRKTAGTVYYLESKKLRTDFMLMEEPPKPLVRFI